jgi:hypothetical protein
MSDDGDHIADVEGEEEEQAKEDLSNSDVTTKYQEVSESKMQAALVPGACRQG